MGSSATAVEAQLFLQGIEATDFVERAVVSCDECEYSVVGEKLALGGPDLLDVCGVELSVFQGASKDQAFGFGHRQALHGLDERLDVVGAKRHRQGSRRKIPDHALD